MINRRSLISRSAAGALAWHALSGRAATAASTLAPPTLDGTPPQFFIYIQMQGAWDPCLAFDPKDRTALLPGGERAFDQPYAIADVRSYGGIALAPQGQPLGAYADRLAIINGIDMEVDTGHIADTVMSGTLLPRQANAPFVQAIVARRNGFVRSRILPHVYAAYDGNFFAGPYGDSTVVASAADVGTMLNVGADGATTAAFAVVQDLLTSYREQLPEAEARRVFGDYIAALPPAEQVVTTLQGGGFTLPAATDTAAGMAQLFGQLFARGLAGSVTWALGSKYAFDTHANHYADHPLVKAVADTATLMAELGKIPLDEHTSVGDRTTIILASEFSRTARLNGNAGKDHNTHSNSLVLLGHGVKAGVYGASGTRKLASGTLEAHAALPVDWRSGAPAEQGRVMKIRDVWAGLGPVFGTDLRREFGADAKAIQFFG